MRKFIELVDINGNTVYVRASHVIAVRVNVGSVYMQSPRAVHEVAVDTAAGTYLQGYTSAAAALAAQEEIMIELEDMA